MKSVAEFHKNAAAKDGLQNWCIECFRSLTRGEKAPHHHDETCRCKGCVARINAANPDSKFCPGCQKLKLRNEFSGNSPRCKPCCADLKRAATQSLTPDLRQRTNLSRRLTRYKISLDQFIEMFERQGGWCPGGHAMDMGEAQVDHDHTCCPGREACGACVRGLLCGDCNTALGRLRDNPNRAIALATYLMSFEDVLSNLNSDRGIQRWA